MHRELTPVQLKQIVQEFMTRKVVGNKLRQNTINDVDRLGGVSRYIVGGIGNQAVEAR